MDLLSKQQLESKLMNTNSTKTKTRTEKDKEMDESKFNNKNLIQRQDKSPEETIDYKNGIKTHHLNDKNGSVEMLHEDPNLN